MFPAFTIEIPTELFEMVRCVKEQYTFPCEWGNVIWNNIGREPLANFVQV